MFHHDTAVYGLDARRPPARDTGQERAREADRRSPRRARPAARAANGVAVLVALLAAGPACAQTGDPFPEPIEAEDGVVVVEVAEFATIPDVDGEPPRLMTLVEEPASGRLFVSEMRGTLYTVSQDGASVTEYLDLNDPAWGVEVLASWRELGVQSFALHPRFADPEAPGYGKLYTWMDVPEGPTAPDFASRGGETAHHTVLLEWTAADAAAATYDGGPPRELARFEQPYGNHNGGGLAFNPLAGPDDADFGLLYVGVGDGGSGGDPHDMAEDLSSGFGKILRIDPLGADGRTGEYGIPDSNPFVGDAGALDEVYAYGLRNPQHFAWDPLTGAMFVADIGQNTVEEVSPVTAGADLGWNEWEGSYLFLGRGGVDASDPRGDADVTYPVAEYDHEDPLLTGRAAVTGLHVYREGAVPALQGRLLFGDLPSGEIFHVSADRLPDGGQDPIRRVLLDGGSGPRTLLELVREKNVEQGREPAGRVDLRLGADAAGRLFLLGKHDGVIRVVGG